MKTTIELPDDLARAMKAHAALEGLKLRVFMEQAVRLRLSKDPSGERTRVAAGSPARRREAAAWLRRWTTLGRRIEDCAVDPRPLTDILREERR
ncbi:MAG: hypothetical protein BWK77_06350 [Verrucomicrobia bacterium A1]|nr:MAG: hypothetical protein BWK77_06350 [Verrucomicrobia bacterium A1]